MRACPRCGTNVVDGRVVCERCGAEAPQQPASPYGRGFLNLLKTRIGIRILAVLVGLLIFGVGTFLGVPQKAIIVFVMAVFGLVTIYTVVSIFRS